MYNSTSNLKNSEGILTRSFKKNPTELGLELPSRKQTNSTNTSMGSPVKAEGVFFKTRPMDPCPEKDT